MTNPIGGSTGSMSPRAWGVLLGCLSLVVFALFVALGSAERGKIAAFSFFAISMSMRIKWPDHRDTSFWIAASLIFVTHALLVFGVPWSPERNPAIIFAPMAIIDIFLLVGIFGLAKKVAH